MPINGSLLGAQIQAQLASIGFTGTMVPQLSMAIGNGIVTNVLSTAIYNGVSTGLGLGTGASIGTLSGGIIIGSTVGNLIFLQCTAQGLIGSKMQPMSMAIGNAVASHMTTAIVQGVSTIVGIGTGTGIIVGIIGPMMASIILAQMVAVGLVGTKNFQLANGIGYGVAAAFQTAIVNTTITGVAVGPVPPAFPPIPSVGTDTGKIF